MTLIHPVLSEHSPRDTLKDTIAYVSIDIISEKVFLQIAKY